MQCVILGVDVYPHSNYTFHNDIYVHGYTMRMPMAIPCTCARQSYGHVHDVAMSMCVVLPRASAWAIYRAGILLANMRGGAVIKFIVFMCIGCFIVECP